MGNIGWVQLLIVLVIVLLLFGGKRLRNLGGDLGSAIKGFKKAMDSDSEANKDAPPHKLEQQNQQQDKSSESKQDTTKEHDTVNKQ
ncbi:twin-arginine translocase TatA/TatE family subunit [Zooshikella sp. RANM57]|uniref:twin-arginine translocase TatA/TatE family subunit n=1 Tax=Zooshikella sp. RANM57 TaxID=3425863 RepID=UPI003D701D8D